MNTLFKQLWRFLIVGGTAFFIDYTILFCCTEFGNINYLISSMISFSVSVIYNYILSTRWVFDTVHRNNPSIDLLIFVILSLIGLSINQGIMYIGVTKFHLHYLLTKLFSTSLVMVYNFITRKLFLEH